MLSRFRLDAPPPRSVDRLAGFLAKYWVAAVLVFGLLLYLPALGVRPFRFEEGNRAAQAFAILHSGSWWRLQIFDVPYFNKPPFLPWLIALLGMVFGSVNEWATRLPPVLSTLAGAIAAGQAARRITSGDRLAALAAGIFYLGCVFMLVKARVSETDTLVSAYAGIALALWMARGGLSRSDWLGLDRWGWIGVVVAFAAIWLSKGPIPLLFPLLPMIALPIVERRPRPVVGVLVALVVSALPVLFWAWLNRDIINAHQMAGQMRVTAVESGGGASIGLEPFLAAVVNLLPGLLLAIAWLVAIWRNRRDPDGRPMRQVALVLVLAALPIALLVVFWPSGRGRYAMPSAWPVAVMAGLGLTMFWRVNRLAGGLLITTVVAGLIAASVLNLAVDGHTKGQHLNRSRAAALAAAVRPLPDGRIFLLVDDPDANVLVYGNRSLTLIAGPDKACGPAVGLIADAAGVQAAEATGTWQAPQPIGENWLSLLRPTATTAHCLG